MCMHILTVLLCDGSASRSFQNRVEQNAIDWSAFHYGTEQIWNGHNVSFS